jgi:hypothetical protein
LGVYSSRDAERKDPGLDLKGTGSSMGIHPC